uniref:Uncharacterized protein n=1 Tax=Arundo donax TaxID=35708 RepID=A0A0A9AXH7_ARUDO
MLHLETHQGINGVRDLRCRVWKPDFICRIYKI